MTSAPGEPESPGQNGAPFPGACDERGHGGEMIRIGGVAKPEETGDCNHDQKRCSVGEAGQVLVQAEH